MALARRPDDLRHPRQIRVYLGLDHGVGTSHRTPPGPARQANLANLVRLAAYASLADLTRLAGLDGLAGIPNTTRLAVLAGLPSLTGLAALASLAVLTRLTILSHRPLQRLT